MLTGPRSRTSRSSTILSPRITPMRRIFGRGACAPFAGAFVFCACVAMLRFPLEGCLLHRLQHLGQEVLLQGLPLVVDGGGKQAVEHVWFRHLATDHEPRLDAEDLLP